LPPHLHLPPQQHPLPLQPLQSLRLPQP